MYLGAEPAQQAAQRVEQLGQAGDLTEAAPAIEALTRELTRLAAELQSRRERHLAEQTPVPSESRAVEASTTFPSRS